jgi:putative chitinase
MTATLDRAAFFAAVRLNPFPGSLSVGQVSGIEAILDACPVDTPLEHLAYDLGTCPIETGWTMLPIKEKGGAAYLARMYDIRGDRPAKARELGNVNPGDGIAFCGRGYVQLTGRANYRKATQRLRALGLIGADQDLETNPDLAMHPDVAAAVLFIGTREGWFTGKKLSDYLGAGKTDWTGARRIINGQDLAGEIALHAQAFAAALKKAGYTAGAVTQKIPTPPVKEAPLGPPIVIGAPIPRIGAGATVQTGGFWASLKSLFKKAA